MEDDNIQSVHGDPQAARIVEQHPAQAQQRQHNQQWYTTLMDQGASAGAFSVGGRTQSFAQVWAFPLGQQYGLTSSGSVIGAMDAARTLQVQNTITQEKQQDEI